MSTENVFDDGGHEEGGGDESCSQHHEGQGPAGEEIVQKRYFYLVKMQGIMTEHYCALAVRVFYFSAILLCFLIERARIKNLVTITVALFLLARSTSPSTIGLIRIITLEI